MAVMLDKTNGFCLDAVNLSQTEVWIFHLIEVKLVTAVSDKWIYCGNGILEVKIYYGSFFACILFFVCRYPGKRVTSFLPEKSG